MDGPKIKGSMLKDSKIPDRMNIIFYEIIEYINILNLTIYVGKNFTICLVLEVSIFGFQL